MQGLRGPIPTVTAEQARQARAIIDAGGSVSSAARTLNISRSSLVRSLNRENLANKDVKAEIAALKAELTELRQWRDMTVAFAPPATSEAVTQ